MIAQSAVRKMTWPNISSGLHEVNAVYHELAELVREEEEIWQDKLLQTILWLIGNVDHTKGEWSKLR